MVGESDLLEVFIRPPNEERLRLKSRRLNRSWVKD